MSSPVPHCYLSCTAADDSFLVTEGRIIAGMKGEQMGYRSLWKTLIFLGHREKSEFKKWKVLNFKRKEWKQGQDGDPRGSWTSPSCGYTDTQLCTEQFPLREIQKLAEWHLHIRPQKVLTSKWKGKPRHTLTINPYPGTAPHCWDGIPSSISLRLVLPWVAKTLDHTCSAPTFKASTRGTGPSDLALIVKGTCIQSATKTIADIEAAFKQVQETTPAATTALPLDSAQREPAKVPASQFLSWRGLTLSFTAAAWGSSC